MKADLSRLTFDPRKHYRAVNLQQGRVLMDADWNEQNAIGEHRTETETRDVIGTCGAPKHAAGFALTNVVNDLPPAQRPAAQAMLAQSPLLPGDFFISAGRFYAHGILCENESPVRFSEQPYVRQGMPLATAGLYVAYLDTWSRHLTALNDPAIREVALGGPDTTTRSQNVWQVRLLRVGGATAAGDCATEFPEWQTETAPSTGRLAAQAKPADVSEEPCIVAPGAGYRRLENQLYRVEIHTAGNLNQATFKWSRENGSVVAAWKSQNGSDLVLTAPGRDDVLGFAPGQWVELIDDARELAGEPGVLVKLDKVEGATLTVAAASMTADVDRTKFSGNPRVRRWESAGALTVEIPATNDGWIALEDGVEIKFAAGTFRTGDYWMVPARTRTGTIEWPKDAAAQPEQRRPQGIEHRYCKLGLVRFDGTALTFLDCRPLFPPLTELEPDDSLALHNKHLHGWGVVCGLQVHCAGDREEVRIEKGHAISCEGEDIFNRTQRTFRVVDRAASLGLLDANGDGEVQLTVARRADGAPAFDLRRPPAGAAGGWLDVLLEGTLLGDIWEECLEPLLALLRKRFLDTKAGGKKLVPESDRRRIAAWNLLIQLVNKTHGKKVYLSPEEHALLEETYRALIGLATSQTFCGIKDGLADFPNYPFKKPKIDTAFGKAGGKRVKIAPDGRRAYSFGGDGVTTVREFDLRNGEMTAEIELPAASAAGATVEDVTFFTVGNKLHLLVAAHAGTRSTLFGYNVTTRRLVGDPFPVNGKRIVRVEQGPHEPSFVYATVQGEGLYRVQPGRLTDDVFDRPTVAFSATGPLAVRETFACALAAASESGPATTSGRLVVIQLGTKPALLNSVPLVGTDRTPATSDDDLAFVIAERRTKPKSLKKLENEMLGDAYVVVNPRAGGTEKRVLVIDLRKGATRAEIALPTAGSVRLAATIDQNYIVTALEDRFELVWLNVRKNTLNQATLPVQIGPSALAIAAETKDGRVVVANFGSHTLSIIPGNLIGETQPIDVARIEAYRREMLAAFFGVLVRIAQRVKDCVCEQLLVNCPECQPDDNVVVLARIEVKARRVYHICNFARREVVTFPKLFYWLSAVPVIPLVTEAIQRFCCMTLPDTLEKTMGKSGDLFSAKTAAALGGKMSFQHVAENFKGLLGGAQLTSGHLLQGLATRVFSATTKKQIRFDPQELVQTEAATARDQLAEQGVEVAATESYDEALLAGKLSPTAAAPLQLKAGEKVRLYTRAGKIVYVTREKESAEATPVTGKESKAAPAQKADIAEAAAPEATEVSRLQEDMERLRSELGSLQKTHLAALAARDREIETLKASTAALKQDLTAVAELRTALNKLTTAAPVARKTKK